MAEITADLAGCWLSGHMGWHNNHRVVDVAETYGFTVPDDYASPLADYRENGSAAHEDSWEAVVGQGGLSDMATDYLQGLAPEGFAFVWDMGELCLMSEGDQADMF